jgi:hypothetical protein
MTSYSSFLLFTTQLIVFLFAISTVVYLSFFSAFDSRDYYDDYDNYSYTLDHYL